MIRNKRLLILRTVFLIVGITSQFTLPAAAKDNRIAIVSQSLDVWEYKQSLQQPEPSLSQLEGYPDIPNWNPVTDHSMPQETYIDYDAPDPKEKFAR
jgi:hypothetical protein